MSTPIQIADMRASQSSSPIMFLAAFHIGRRAGAGEDSDAYMRALINQGDHAAAAGYLEGLAAARRVPDGAHPFTCDCVPCQVRRSEQERMVRRLRAGATA